MLNYNLNVYPVDVGKGKLQYFAEYMELKGCAGQGDNTEEAIAELNENAELWLEDAKEEGINIPIPIIRKELNYSGKILLRLSKNTHKNIAELAEYDGISINQFINNSLCEIIGYRNAISDLKTETKLQIRSIIDEAIKESQKEFAHSANYWNNYGKWSFHYAN